MTRHLSIMTPAKWCPHTTTLVLSCGVRYNKWFLKAYQQFEVIHTYNTHRIPTDIPVHLVMFSLGFLTQCSTLEVSTMVYNHQRCTVTKVRYPSTHCSMGQVLCRRYQCLVEEKNLMVTVPLKRCHSLPPLELVIPCPLLWGVVRLVVDKLGAILGVTPIQRRTKNMHKTTGNEWQSYILCA